MDRRIVLIDTEEGGDWVRSGRTGGAEDFW